LDVAAYVDRRHHVDYATKLSKLIDELLNLLNVYVCPDRYRYSPHKDLNHWPVRGKPIQKPSTIVPADH